MKPAQRVHPRSRWRRALYLSTAGIVLLGVVQFAAGRRPARDAMFSDIASAMTDASTTANGVCWGDYDGDGDQDLYIVNNGKSAPPELWRNDGKGTFTSVAERAGVNKLRRAKACAFFDADNDGDADLFVTSDNSRRSPGVPLENKLFRNDGGGTFSDISAASGLRMPRSGAASSDWADVDRDGDYDGFIAVRWGRRDAEKLNALFEQSGPLSFTDVAVTRGLADPEGPQNAFLGNWFDYDGDGDLDLLLAIDWWGAELYRNDGGVFARVTTTAFPPARDDTPGAPPNNAMGVTWGDYDNDGCSDVFITGMNVVGQGGFEASVLGDLASRLYRNNCNGTFSDMTRAVGFRPTGVVEWAANFVDFDNDGDLDLSVVAGHAVTPRTPPGERSEARTRRPGGQTASQAEAPRAKRSVLARVKRRAARAGIQLFSAFRRIIPDRLAQWMYRYEAMIPAIGSSGRTAAMPNFLYRNQLVESGVARFVNVTHAVGAANVGAARGSAWADMDNDGDLDWFIPNRGTPNRLFRNNGPVGHYLRVHLVGARLRDAVGAWVKITVGAGLQVRHVHILDGYLSQSQLDPHFGLGAAERVEEVWVRWPGETRWVLACRGVPANTRLTVTQGRGCAW